MLQITVVPCAAQACLIRPWGDLDYISVPLARQTIESALRPPVHWLLWDASNLQNVDSSGAGLLLWSLRTVGEGHVAILRAPSALRKMLALTRLSRLMLLVDSMDDLAEMKGWEWVQSIPPPAEQPPQLHLS